MEYLAIQQAALINENILDESVRKNYHCEQGIGRRNDRAIASRGHFCVAFPMFANSGTTKICYRIWYENIETTSRAAKHITTFLNNIDLPYFVNCRFIPEAIQVEGQKLPGMAMEWIEGASLDKYLKDNVQTPQKIRDLADAFLLMCRDLNDRGIAHGDLSNANIIVTNNGAIKLIDYDSVYVPRMGNNFKQTTGGCADFQHPQRLSAVNRNMSNRVDYFSQQVIYLSILAISKDPTLVNYIGEEGLLFSAVDFQSEENFIESRGCKAIVKLNDTTLNHLLDELKKAVCGPLCEVRTVCEVVKEIPVRHSSGPTNKPRVIPQNTPKMHRNKNFCPMCGKRYPSEITEVCKCKHKRTVVRTW